MTASRSPELPPGFRFHPTDEELIVHYLRNQVLSRPCPVPIISELNIYKFDPWELPGKSEFGEEEWYFFSPRDRKYPNGERPNRATMSGYWKATGTDKAIYSGSRYVGVKKVLVFYKGRPPKGVKSDWIMHEYRLGGANSGNTKPKGSTRLDDWVLCRIYQKKQKKNAGDEEDEASYLLLKSPYNNDKGTVVDDDDDDKGAVVDFPRSSSLANLLQAPEYMSVDDMLNLYSSGPYGDFHAMAAGLSQPTPGDAALDLNSMML